MGLFSTLASATGPSNNSGGAVVQSSTTPTSSAIIATVVQLYSNQQIILMDDTPNVTGYSSLTYQAVQVGASRDDAVAVAELKNRHSNPDLGVWNCRVVVGGNNGSNSNSKTSNENVDPLVDSLLAKLAVSSETVLPPSVYCMTVDLSDEPTVEPNLSALQAALIRHLIEHPPQTTNTTDGDASVPTTTNTTQTTSLYDLQTVQFGLASDEKAAARSIEETAKDVRVGLMICAVVSSHDDATSTVDESSEAAYKKKQARALVVYHLRKFASSINAALCFVERPTPQENNESSPDPASEESKESGAADASSSSSTNNNNNNNTQVSISYDKLSQLWRDMATGIPVWEQKQQTETGKAAAAAAVESVAETASDVSPTALYGPGRQQEDLIESLLLRNANYPGHWDASKDSLWVALPCGTNDGSNNATISTTGTSAAGDDGWLTQLRDSIASALPPTSDTADENDKSSASVGEDGKPKEKDAAVSSFFESLLKNP